jgi:PAS domain S-box-containing protein
MTHLSETLSKEEKLHLQTELLNSLGQAILVVDLKGRIVYWNQFAEVLFGWNEAEVQNRNIDEVFSTLLLMESVNKNLSQLQNGEGWSGQFPVKRQDGTTLMGSFNASLIQNERQLISLISFSMNSTENQKLQEANRLLAEASARLNDAMDYETSLKTLVQLAVPQLADWCAIHLFHSDGTIERVALAPAELSELPASLDWLQNSLPLDENAGLPAVFRSGEPRLVTDATSDMLAVSAAIKSYMIVPLTTRPRTYGAITFVATESGRCFDQTTLALAENLVSYIAIYMDKARLFRESQQLNAELEQHVIERTSELSTAVEQLKQSEATIQTLFRISNKLNGTLEIDTILDALAHEAIRIVNGESGFAGLRTPEGMNVRKYIRKGTVTPFENTWSSGNGIPGWVLKHKIPYGTSDAANDPVMDHNLSINADVRTIICTPIFDSSGEVLAYFDIRNKQDGEGFSIGDQEMLMALAPSASIAIQNALAYQQRLATVAELKESSKQLRALAASIELAREEERTQISRDLHDQLGQALTATKFDLAWLTKQLKKLDAPLAQKTKAITAQLDTLIKTVRRISTELRPGMLDDLGLAASIEWQALDFTKRTGIACEVKVRAENLSLERAKSLALFRIFQEAITNVSRHARAKKIEVELSTTPETITLQVHDDGRGIQTKEIADLSSIGLLGMKERATRLGGTFSINGVPGEGTTVTAAIPLKPVS